MSKVADVLGNVAGLVGLLVCLVAGFARASGAYLLAGSESMTWFTIGVALMVFACFAKLHGLTSGRSG